MSPACGFSASLFHLGGGIAAPALFNFGDLEARFGDLWAHYPNADVFLTSRGFLTVMERLRVTQEAASSRPAVLAMPKSPENAVEFPQDTAVASGHSTENESKLAALCRDRAQTRCNHLKSNGVGGLRLIQIRSRTSLLIVPLLSPDLMDSIHAVATHPWVPGGLPKSGTGEASSNVCESCVLSRTTAHHPFPVHGSSRSKPYARTLCGLFFTMVEALRAGFLEGFTSGLFD